MSAKIDFARADVLRFASHITTDPSDAAAVCANAQPLLTWLDAAPTRPERDARWRAMTRHDANLSLARSRARGRSKPPPFADSPDAFLGGVRTLHEFLTTGSPAAYVAHKAGDVA